MISPIISMGYIKIEVIYKMRANNKCLNLYVIHQLLVLIGSRNIDLDICSIMFYAIQK